MSRRLSLTLTLVASLTLCAGCGTRSMAVKLSATQFASQSTSKADETRAADNCPAGTPRALPDWPVSLTQIVYRDGFVLEHSSEWKVPYWVCEHLTPDELGGNLRRADDFRADEALPQGLRAELKDYKYSGYDRGHQAPAGNQTRDARLKSETFFLSNMVPQNGNQNRVFWAHLEAVVRSWAEDGIATNVKVITGPVFHTTEDLANGYSVVETIGSNAVGVPKAIFKIVHGRVDGSPRVVAFSAPNRPIPGGSRFADYIVSVAELETLTGYNFMPDLEPGDRVKLETAKGTLFH